MSCEFLNLVAKLNHIPITKENYIWNKAINLESDLSFIVGNDEDDKELGSLFQKICYDSLMDLTLQELISFSDENPGSQIISDLHSSMFNNFSKTLSQTNLNKNKLHKLELLSSYKTISDILGLPSIDYNNLLITCGMNGIAKSTPTMYVFSSLYSYFQKDRKREMKPNDYYDIINSCLGVAHCNYFFTESNFCSILKADLKLNQRFDVQIEHKPEAILDALKSLN